MTPQDALQPHSLFRNDDWNQYRIVAEGPRIRTWINGQLVGQRVDVRLVDGEPELTVQPDQSSIPSPPTSSERERHSGRPECRSGSTPRSEG